MQQKIQASECISRALVDWAVPEIASQGFVSNDSNPRLPSLAMTQLRLTSDPSRFTQPSSNSDRQARDVQQTDEHVLSSAAQPMNEHKAMCRNQAPPSVGPASYLWPLQALHISRRRTSAKFRRATKRINTFRDSLFLLQCIRRRIFAEKSCLEFKPPESRRTRELHCLLQTLFHSK